MQVKSSGGKSNVRSDRVGGGGDKWNSRGGVSLHGQEKCTIIIPCFLGASKNHWEGQIELKLAAYAILEAIVIYEID